MENTPRVLTEDQAKEEFDLFLDEIFPKTEMMNMVFYPSVILKNCDPIAYRITFGDFIDEMTEDFLVEGYTA
jgi:hypothetical protein